MRYSALLFVLLFAFAATWNFASAGAAPTGSLQALPVAALPVFLQQSGSRTIPVTPTAGPTQALGTTGTSVMPPGPPFGGKCSADNSTGPNCSAIAPSQRCSAFNDADNFCSADTTASGGDRSCSAGGNGAACSVLPPSFGGPPSRCSTIPGTTGFGAFCSSIGAANRQLCSTKGAGISQCSAFGPAVVSPSQCSVLNFNGISRSFCSTKFNQPTIAKSCSAFADAAECSVAAGVMGVCTTFGAALAPSCSAFTPASFCSVIGGPGGNPCVQ